MSDPAGPPDTRPPNKPPTTPPPKPPTSDATYADALLDEVDRLLADLKNPARQDFSLAAVGPDGPAETTRPTSGEERSPRSPVAPATAAREGAGSHIPGPGDSFSTPQPLGPPRFGEGERRLVGRVGDPDEVEAEVLARIIRALHT
jgi:hypothetical protein